MHYVKQTIKEKKILIFFFILFYIYIINYHFNYLPNKKISTKYTPIFFILLLYYKRFIGSFREN